MHAHVDEVGADILEREADRLPEASDVPGADGQRVMISGESRATAARTGGK